MLDRALLVWSHKFPLGEESLPLACWLGSCWCSQGCSWPLLEGQTLLTCAHLVCWDHRVFFWKTAFEPVGSQCVLLHEAIWVAVCLQEYLDTWLAYRSANTHCFCKCLCLNQTFHLTMLYVQVAILCCFFTIIFVLWEHRFYHVVILQEWLWQQVFSLQSCTNKFWLILIRITKWYKMKQKSTNYANENSTNICLMQWFVSHDSLTACTIYCSALLSQLGVRKVLQYGVGGGIYTDPIASTISIQLALTTPPPSLPSTLLDFFHWIKSGYAAGSSHISTILLQNWLWVTGNPGTGK